MANKYYNILSGLNLNVIVVCIVFSMWLLIFLVHFFGGIQDVPFKKEKTEHDHYVELFYGNRKYWRTSNLGSILLKNKNYKDFKRYDDKTYEILIWTPLDKKRHGSISSQSSSILRDCSVKNCKFTEDVFSINNVDAVLVNIRYGEIPKTPDRNPNQRWILYSEEPPTDTFKYAKNMQYYSLNNIFNWTMTYRHDADIPIPLGRFVPKARRDIEDLEDELDYEGINNLIPFYDKKLRNVLVAVLVKKCELSKHNEFIEDLKRYIDIDVYSTCYYADSKDCYADGRECLNFQKYLYVLLHDEPKCDDYFSIEFYHYALYYGAVPVVRGTSQEVLMNILPALSFINADDMSAYQLADLIGRNNYRQEKLLDFHIWRNDLDIVMEHGYFGPKISPQYCRLCEGLNYNSRNTSIYHEGRLKRHFDAKILCDNDNLI